MTESLLPISSNIVYDNDSIVTKIKLQMKLKRTIQTYTTFEHEAVQRECAPYFVQIHTLPKSQLDHLQSIGLLDKQQQVVSIQSQSQQLLDHSKIVENNIIKDNDTIVDNDDNNETDEDTIIELPDTDEPIDINNAAATAVTKASIKSDMNMITPEVNTTIDISNLSKSSSSTSLYDICLLRTKHGEYLKQVWDLSTSLRSSFVSLDASRTWMIYWSLHGCDLLNYNTTNTNNKNNNNTNTNNKEEVIDDDDDDDDDDDNDPSTKKYGYPTTIKEYETIVMTISKCFTIIKDPIRIPKDIVERDTYLQSLLIQHGSIATDAKNYNQNEEDYYEFHQCGGYGGNYNQLPHAATTYAAINALCILAPDEAKLQQNKKNNASSSSSSIISYLKEIKSKLYPWIIHLLLPQTNGSLRMHHDGEIDVRATYCLLSVCSLLGYMNHNNHNTKCILLENWIIDYIVSCQTYEGGFGGEPYSEAHGGYTFCSVAAIQIWLFHTKNWEYIKANIHIDNLLTWLSLRQLSYEGGFNGRCNKLVDGCYSYWQGSAIVIVSNWVHDILHYNGNGQFVIQYDPWIIQYDNNNHKTKTTKNRMNQTNVVKGDDDNKKDNDNVDIESSSSSSLIISLPSIPLLFDHAMLERYILLCAQDVHGGLRDKPSKSRDFYHTCYNLSGLSIAYHYYHHQNHSSTSTSTTTSTTSFDNHNDNQGKNHNIDNADHHNYHFGHATLSQVAQTHPCYNIRIEKVKYIQEQFSA